MFVCICVYSAVAHIVFAIFTGNRFLILKTPFRIFFYLKADAIYVAALLEVLHDTDSVNIIKNLKN